MADNVPRRLYDEMKAELKAERDKYLSENTELRKELVELRKDLVELRKDLVDLSGKLAVREWPNRVRSIVFDMESEFSLTALHVCKHCANVHNPPDCNMNKKLYPSNVKEQRIFLRRQRWIWFMYQSNVPIVTVLIEYLEKCYNKLRLKPDAEKTPSEKFIATLPDMDNVIYYFTDSIARVFEYCSEETKKPGVINQELLSVGIFKPPSDIFIAYFINICSPIRENGEIRYQSDDPLEWKVDVAEFIPKKLTERKN